MKKIITFLLFVFAFSSNAKIQQQSEDSLNDDLNYRLDQESDYDRDVASDESKQEQNSQGEDASERDVASENENDLQAPIQYWKY